MRRPTREADAETKFQWMKRVGILVTFPLFITGFLLLLANLPMVVGLVFFAGGAAVVMWEFFRLAVRDEDSFPPNCRL